jgi:hypothetical protein
LARRLRNSLVWPLVFRLIIEKNSRQKMSLTNHPSKREILFR